MYNTALNVACILISYFLIKCSIKNNEDDFNDVQFNSFVDVSDDCNSISLSQFSEISLMFKFNCSNSEDDFPVGARVFNASSVYDFNPKLRLIKSMYGSDDVAFRKNFFKGSTINNRIGNQIVSYLAR